MSDPVITLLTDFVRGQPLILYVDERLLHTSMAQTYGQFAAGDTIVFDWVPRVSGDRDRRR